MAAEPQLWDRWPFGISYQSDFDAPIRIVSVHIYSGHGLYVVRRDDLARVIDWLCSIPWGEAGFKSFCPYCGQSAHAAWCEIFYAG